MSYAFAGEGSLNYFPCKYGSSKLTFRGPARSTLGDYLVTLGGTETFGKFVEAPFPHLLERRLSLPVINLGCMNAGPDLYLNEPDILAIATSARACVVQILGAQNMSNRYYSVHRRRNDRFLVATHLLRGMFPTVDFTEFNFTRHLLTALQTAAPDRFEVVAEELRAGWVLQMRNLLSRLRLPTVLLWASDAVPPEPQQRSKILCDAPLVDAEMINAIRPMATRYIEVISSTAARAEGVSAMKFSPLERHSAAALPGQAVHAEIAAQVASSLRAYIPLG
ncbi:MAG: hypothetical protein RIR95_2266 [Pseudomonadota bacterium]